MPFQLGSRFIRNIPLADYLQKAAPHFQAIELHTDPSYLSLNFAFNAIQKKTIRIYQERYHFSLTMHAPFLSKRLGALEEEERQIALSSFLAAMRLAAELGIKLLTFHPSALEPGRPDSYRENCRYEEESLALLLNEAQKLDQILLIENMPRLPEFHPNTMDGSRFQELLWLFPQPEFGLTIDIGHALQAGVSLPGLLKMDRIRHFHLHENDRKNDSHAPIAANLDWWAELLPKLAKKFPGAIGILEMKLLEEELISLANLLKITEKPGQKRSQKKAEQD